MQRDRVVEVDKEARPLVVAAHDDCLGVHLAAALAEGEADVLVLLRPQDDIDVVSHIGLLEERCEPLSQEICSLVRLHQASQRLKYNT